MHDTMPEQERKYNRLSNEKSPYLLQHADNPIWWYPWGELALETAKRENKPIFLSIGYSTCYWCHFMEKDSFEKDDVAEILNKYFIAIKVDREERPDVDQIYMTSLIAMRGSGGWPMSLFLTPEGEPFYGASTIPHDDFIHVLNDIAETWKRDRIKIEDSGKRVSFVLKQYLMPTSQASDIRDSAFHNFFKVASDNFDETYAGFGAGTKFPRPHVLRFLLKYHRRSGQIKSLEMVNKTLKSMARGGIHDIISGGFHRYSVDSRWEIPHFEKMLYDNAGMVLALLDAYQVTDDKEFAAVAANVLDWVRKEMTHKEGGFSSAQDAGDYNEEGYYYAWGYNELKKILTGEEFEYVKSKLSVTEYGNFDDNRNVFYISSRAHLPFNDNIFKSVREKLLKGRATRKNPRLDDKIITAWNGFMISAFARGYRVLGDETYLKEAEKAVLFIKQHLTNKDGGLMRHYSDGKASKNATLNDYAFLIDGLIELYQADFNPDWIDWAIDLQKIQDEKFIDNLNGGYFFDDGKDKTLISRMKDYDDQAMPSGNSMSALNLLRLAAFTYNPDYRKRAKKLLMSISGLVEKSPFNYPQMLSAMDFYLDSSKEIAIVGERDDPDIKEMIKVLSKRYLPNVILATAPPNTTGGNLKLVTNKTSIGDKPTAYVCEQGLCLLPTTEIKTLIKQADKYISLFQSTPPHGGRQE